MQLWDTVGQERLRTFTKSFYKAASAIILVYDCTDRHSFENINQWMREIDTHATKDVLKILVANKIDKENREITSEEGSELAEQYGIAFYETSAMTGENVEEVFKFCAQTIVKRKKFNPSFRITSVSLKTESEFISTDNGRRKFRWCKWLSSF